MLYVLQHRADYSWCQPHREDGVLGCVEMSRLRTEGPEWLCCPNVVLEQAANNIPEIQSWWWVVGQRYEPPNEVRLHFDSIFSYSCTLCISCVLNLVLFWPYRRTSMHYEVKGITAKKNCWQSCLLILSAGIKMWGIGTALDSMDFLDWLSCLIASQFTL